MAVDDSYTKALLHCDGENYGTVYTDESGKTWTGVNSPQTLTSDPVFGSAFLNVDTTGRLHTPLVADFDVHNIDFTVDFWVKYDSSNGGKWISCLSDAGGGSYRGWYLYNNYGYVVFKAYDGSGTKTHECQFDAAGTWFTNNTWHHCAFVRSGNNYYVFMDGVLQETYTNATELYHNVEAGAVFNIGGDGGVDGYGTDWYLKVDEFRFSSGIARWTSNFTVPAEAYHPPDIYDETSAESLSLSAGVSSLDLPTGINAETLTVDDTTLGTYSESSLTVAESFTVDDYVDDATWHDDVGESFSLDDTTEGILPIVDEAIAETFSVDDSNLDEITGSADTEPGLELPSLTVAGTTNTSTTFAVELDSPFFTIEAYTGGALGGYFPVITIDSEAKTGEVASGASDFPVMTMSGNTGAVLDTNLWTPYDIALSSGATTNTTSNLDKDIPSLTVAGHAYVELLGNLAQDLPRLRSSAIALLDVRTNTDAQIPRYSLSGYSYNGYLVDLAENIPGFNISATGYSSGGTVTLAESLPSLWLVSVAHGGQTGYYSVPVMNIRKGAISEWNLGFNSVTYFNGKTVATDGTKIYEIGSTVDDVSTPDADITSNIKTGNLDLANNAKIRFTDAYANIKADGNVKLQFELDESTTYDFTMTMHDLDDTHEEKVNLGKGMKARVYAVSLYNIDGSKFRLNKLQLIGDKLD